MIRAAGTHGTSLLSGNDSTGGSDRRVDVGVGIPMRMIVNQPATNPSSAGFGVFGFLGVSSANQAAIAPGVGSVAFQICVFDPSNAMLFAFADTLGGNLCGGAVSASTAPWVFELPGGSPVYHRPCLMNTSCRMLLRW